MLRRDQAASEPRAEAVEAFWGHSERAEWLKKAKWTGEVPTDAIAIICLPHEYPGRLGELEPGVYIFDEAWRKTLTHVIQSIKGALSSVIAASNPEAEVPQAPVQVHLYSAASGGSPLNRQMSISTLATRYAGSDGFVHLLVSTLNAKEVEEARLAYLAERAEKSPPSPLASPSRLPRLPGSKQSASPMKQSSPHTLPPLNSKIPSALSPQKTSTLPQAYVPSDPSTAPKPIKASLVTSTSLPSLKFRPARQRLAVERRGKGVVVQLREAMRLVHETIRRSHLPLHAMLAMWDADKLGKLGIHQLTGALIQVCSGDDHSISFRPSDLRIVFDNLSNHEGALDMLEFEKQLRLYASFSEQEGDSAAAAPGTPRVSLPGPSSSAQEGDQTGTVWSMQESVAFYLSQGASYELAQLLIRELERTTSGDARIPRRNWWAAMWRADGVHESWKALDPPDAFQSSLQLEAVIAPVKPPRRENFADLRRPSRGPPTRIDKVEERAITLKQLQLVIRHIDRRFALEGWHNPEDGSLLRLATLTLYDVSAYIIRPATMPHRCSFVEFLSVSGAPQRPDFVVSHWWGDSVRDVLSCLTQHARDYQFDLKSTAYWICAYAHNLWALNESLALDPADTAFHRSLELAQGMVSVIDRNAIAFSRIWCCYEMSLALDFDDRYDDEDIGEDSFKVDIYTCLPHGGAAGITDGLAPCDERDDVNKDEREQIVPSAIIEGALNMKIQEGESTMWVDRQRILNHLASRPRDEASLKQHWSYNMVNSRLCGRLLPRLMRTTLCRGGPTFRTWLAAQHGAHLRRYEQSFVRTQLSPEMCQEFLVNMPEGLIALSIDVPLVALPDLKPANTLVFRSLQKLSLANSLWLEVLPLWLGSLISLRKLSLAGCARLRQLPDEKIFRKLIVMELLDLTGCVQLFNPDQIGQHGNPFGLSTYASRRGIDMLIKITRHSPRPLKIIDANGIPLPLEDDSPAHESQGPPGLLEMPAASSRILPAAPQNSMAQLLQPEEDDGPTSQCDQIHKRIEKLMSEYDEEPEKDTSADDKVRWAKIEATFGSETSGAMVHHVFNLPAPSTPATPAKNLMRSKSMTSTQLTPAEVEHDDKDIGSPPKKKSSKAKKPIVRRTSGEPDTDQAEWLKWFTERADKRQQMVAELSAGLPPVPAGAPVPAPDAPSNVKL